MAQADESEDLDALVRRVDPDRWLSSRFVAGAVARADLTALYAFDHELTRAPRVGSNPLVGEMRLVWWREVLDEIFEGRTVRRHPAAQALAQVARRRGLQRAPLEEMIDARYRELDPTPMTAEEAGIWAAGAAGAAARLAVQILDPRWEDSAGHAGAWASLWGLGLLNLHDKVAAGEREAARRDLRLGLSEARRLGRGVVPAAAFPAVAHATLARAYLRKHTPGVLGKQWRLVAATALGRI